MGPVLIIPTTSVFNSIFLFTDSLLDSWLQMILSERTQVCFFSERIRETKKKKELTSINPTNVRPSLKYVCMYDFFKDTSGGKHVRWSVSHGVSLSCGFVPNVCMYFGDRGKIGIGSLTCDLEGTSICTCLLILCLQGPGTGRVMREEECRQAVSFPRWRVQMGFFKHFRSRYMPDPWGIPSGKEVVLFGFASDKEGERIYPVGNRRRPCELRYRWCDRGGSL